MATPPCVEDEVHCHNRALVVFKLKERHIGIIHKPVFWFSQLVHRCYPVDVTTADVTALAMSESSSSFVMVKDCSFERSKIAHSEIHGEMLRNQVSWYNHLGDFLNMLKAFIGTNYQALPFAFHNSGLVLGILGVLLIATITDYCIQILVQCKTYIIEDVCEEERAGGMNQHDIHALRKRLDGSIGYGDIAKRAFGNWCYTLTQFLVWFTQYATLISYFIFIGNTVFEIFPEVPAQVPIHNSTPINQTGVSRLGEGVPMLSIPNLNRVKRDLSEEFTMDEDHPLFAFGSNFTHLHFIARNISNMTTVGPVVNITTTTPTRIPNVTASVPPSSFTWISTAPSLRLIMLFPLPFFILTSLVRRLRILSPFSSLAALALTIGAASVLTYIVVGFKVVDDYSLAKISTLPLFLGQIISAYEGIGCVMPIHCSMEGNRHLFPAFLHANVYIVFVILASFGSLGYLRYGENVNQIVVMNIAQHSILSLFVDVTLIISVLFTYPLQGFPVIEIVESYLFGPGRCCGGPEEPRFEYDEIDTTSNIQADSRGLLSASVNSIDLQASQVSVVVPAKVAPWRRNIVRVLLTLSVAAASIALKDSYAYLNVVSGAVGCSLLALILPCCIHMKLRKQNRPTKLINISVITFAVVASISALIEIVMKLVKHTSDV
ncbi:hypothetical protein CAPTEDRAFT_221004 [Capitella teleta]|uniref:Amino acid transporter transmembrane domain-containing protein n=1 Tax=Capitella teleta TaxID=283909 RepID=R7TT19_CAPTE|nr:hypothetical protein CAPTEDRAFT_221004 [Capitella teleta]|eukprot:ELT96757.1 hypothetical protein CAPTEDRAFT_221004 [Capitella teleta]